MQRIIKYIIGTYSLTI